MSDARLAQYLPNLDEIAQLERYRSREPVHACKIAKVAGDVLELDVPDGVDPNVETFLSFLVKHQTQAGDYYVVYSDGMKATLPAPLFERLYQPAAA